MQQPGTTDAAPLRFTAAGTLLAGALSTGETGFTVDSVAAGSERFGAVFGTPFSPLDYPVAESFSPDGRLLAGTVGARGFATSSAERAQSLRLHDPARAAADRRLRG